MDQPGEAIGAMCGNGDRPGSGAEALAMITSGLDYLGAAAVGGDLGESPLGEILLSLEASGTRLAAVRASLLARFDTANAHDDDGYQNSSSWLRDRAGMTHAAARRRVKQSRLLRERPLLAAAMLAGTLSESWTDKLVVMTRSVPDDLRDFADEMVLKVLEAGGDLDDAAQVIARILECAAPRPGPDDPGAGGDEGGFEDRSLRLEATLGGAGVLHANLTPEATAAIQAILDALGKKNGAEDTRTKLQRDHDALKDAADRLLGSRLPAPARPGGQHHSRGSPHQLRRPRRPPWRRNARRGVAHRAARRARLAHRQRRRSGGLRSADLSDRHRDPGLGRRQRAHLPRRRRPRPARSDPDPAARRPWRPRRRGTSSAPAVPRGLGRPPVFRRQNGHQVRVRARFHRLAAPHRP
ncbi:MAG: 13E12 repeat family protein, partial [Streptosporangiales bacterium]|nr:13E12 repeat family protein [Streptosporangiales bacterium]